MGNPLAPLFFFLTLIASAVSGIFVHKFLYYRLKKNWLAFLISLLGIFPLGLILGGIGNLLMLRAVQRPTDLGGVLVVSVGIVLLFILFIITGLSLYLLAVIVSSVYYWIKKK